MDFIDAVAKILTVDDGSGMMCVPRTMGRPDTLPGTCSISSHVVQSFSVCACAMFEGPVDYTPLTWFGSVVTRERGRKI